MIDIFMHFNVIEKCCQVHIKQTVVKLSAQIRQSNTKFTHIKNRIMAVVRLYAFFILHRKARKALSFAQLRRGLLRMPLQKHP